MTTTPDDALDTAREILDGTVCECGHTDTEHANVREGDDLCGECDCPRLRPVVFIVTRAPEQSP